MIKTKSILDQPEESDGKRILVSREKPLGLPLKKLRISDWMKRLAPSTDLMKEWKKSIINWGEFCNRYREEMAEQTDTLSNLAEKSVGEDITLLCHEPEHNPHCHRHILKRLITHKMYNLL